MDFTWNEEQLAFKKAVIEFAQKEIRKDRCEEWGRQLQAGYLCCFQTF